MIDYTYRDAFDSINAIFGADEDDWESKLYDSLNDISIAIVEYRMARHLSQGDLAKQLGVTQAMVSKYESGDYNFTLKSAYELFGKLGISFDIAIGKRESDANERPSRLANNYGPVNVQKDTNASEVYLMGQAS